MLALGTECFRRATATSVAPQTRRESCGWLKAVAQGAKFPVEDRVKLFIICRVTVNKAPEDVGLLLAHMRTR